MKYEINSPWLQGAAPLLFLGILLLFLPLRDRLLRFMFGSSAKPLYRREYWKWYGCVVLIYGVAVGIAFLVSVIT